MYHSLAGVPGRQFSASIGFLGAVHVANETGGKKLRMRNASRGVFRVGRCRRTRVMTGPFRIQSAKKMLPGKKGAVPPVSSGGEYELRKLVATRSFMACMFASKNNS